MPRNEETAQHEVICDDFHEGCCIWATRGYTIHDHSCQAIHSIKSARVAPVKFSRHMGHWRSPEDFWHCWHTVWPQGVRATRCQFSWQMGQVPLMPWGVEFVSSGIWAMFHVTWAYTLLCQLRTTALLVKPRSASLWSNRAIASSGNRLGLGWITHATQWPCAAFASHSVMSFRRVSSTHELRESTQAARLLCPSSCAKDIKSTDSSGTT